MDLPQVSIIIVTWNGLPLLQKCLKSVLATAYENREIVVVDNASTDGTADWIRSHHPSIKIIEMETNEGFSGGNNEGIRQTTSDLIVLLNNDVEVTPDWLDHLVSAVLRTDDTAAVQPKILQFEDRRQFEYAGAAGGFLDRYGYPFARGRIFFNLETDRGQYDTPLDIFWASGAALMLRRSALDKVGLLDERFFMHWEEIDLCWRLKRFGYRIVAEPRSVVYHIGGATLSASNPTKTYYNFRNSLLALYKNSSPMTWWRRFPVRLALDAIAATRALVLGRPSEAWAVVRAYRDAHSKKATFSAERPDPTEEVQPTYRGMVVADFFLKRRHRFTDLPQHRFQS